MAIHPPVLINIALAFGALGLYIVGSRRFYQGRHPFLVFLLTAVLVDAVTAILASFGITPTTEIPGSDFVPWGSMLFLTHMVLASIGFFGFIAVMVTLIFKGQSTATLQVNLTLFLKRKISLHQKAGKN